MGTYSEIGIFVVNLDRSASRMRWMERQLSAFDLGFTRINAIDGDRDDIAGEIARLGLTLGEVRGRPLGPREIGCYLSHIAAFRAVKASGLKGACILEDDVELGRHFPSVLRALAPRCGENIVAKLEAWPKRRMGVAVARAGEFQTIYAPQGLIETGAYFVTRQAIDAMADLETITLPFDHALFAERRDGPLVVSVAPAAAKQSERFQSLIQADRDAGSAAQRRMPRLVREVLRPFVQLFAFGRAIVRVHQRLGVRGVLNIRYHHVRLASASGSLVRRVVKRREVEPGWSAGMGTQPAFPGDQP